MNNFLDFINSDVEVKKTLLTSLPTKTKTNIKKFNETIDEFSKKYEAYRDSVYKYIKAKNKSIKIKPTKKDNKEYIDKINTLQEVRKVFNPYNTYYEKMGFDELVYRISDYYVFNFDSVDKIIDEFIDKFELVGIKLTERDFNYTYYVNKYMKVFLNVRAGKENADSLNKMFEEIYWVNPDIIGHIELNFRKLIRDNSRRFEDYVKRLRRDYSRQYNVESYSDCIRQLEKAYEELDRVSVEDIGDITDKALKGEFDITQYLPTNKFRQSAYSSFISPEISPDDKDAMNKICITLNKLGANLKEYSSYLEIAPMLNEFKTQYEKLATQKDVNYNEIKALNNAIRKKESELDRINRKVFKRADNRALKIESVSEAKKLYSLYKQYDDEYIKVHVSSVLNINMTISEVLDLFYSFDYFKKETIQNVYKLTSYDDIIEKSKVFDEFAMNPTNIIARGLSIFEENNIPRIIANKYKLNNIQINEEDIVGDNITVLNSKIVLIERINKIENSGFTVDQIWFLTKSQKILNEEGK